MKEAKLSKKGTFIVISSVALVLIAALIGIIAGHGVYLKKQAADILNVNDLLSENGMYKYYYDDGTVEVDLKDALVLSDGASLSVNKIVDEDGTVTKGSGTTVNVSLKKQRIAKVNVTSASGKNTSEYDLALAPKSIAGNTIDYNFDGSIDGNIFYNYSGDRDFELPTPVKTYTGASGNTYNYEFLGWYTSPDYAEDTKISSITAGTSGKISLYASFKNASSVVSDDGYTYVTLGDYPQRRVTDFKLLTQLRQDFSSSDDGLIRLNGVNYYKFTPTNVPNLTDNGYTAKTTYFFYMDPVEWRVLKAAGATVTNNSAVTLLATSVLNCASMGEEGGTIKNLYDKYVKGNKINLDFVESYFYDPNRIYYESPAKSAVDDIYNNLFTVSTEGRAQVRTKSFTYRSTWLGTGTKNFSQNAYLLCYSDVVNAANGFDPDYTVNDNNRKAQVTDFAAANGVYIATSTAHRGQGTWWLRGAGDKYTYKDKRIAYVKFTGYVHAYGAMNYGIRSGIRPAMDITYSTSVFN